jgi:hypothetical protein
MRGVLLRSKHSGGKYLEIEESRGEERGESLTLIKHQIFIYFFFLAVCFTKQFNSIKANNNNNNNKTFNPK